MNDLTVVDVKWFTGIDCIGIVLVDTGYGHKAYIGVGREGNTEQQDIDYICERGSRFHLAPQVWPHIKTWTN